MTLKARAFRAFASYQLFCALPLLLSRGAGLPGGELACRAHGVGQIENARRGFIDRTSTIVSRKRTAKEIENA